MTERLEDLIRSNLARYIEGSITLETFEEWLVPTIWPIETTKIPGLGDLVGEIMLRLAEYSNGHWTESELRGLLGRLLEPKPLLRP